MTSNYRRKVTGIGFILLSAFTLIKYIYVCIRMCCLHTFVQRAYKHVIMDTVLAKCNNITCDCTVIVDQCRGVDSPSAEFGCFLPWMFDVEELVTVQPPEFPSCKQRNRYIQICCNLSRNIWFQFSTFFVCFMSKYSYIRNMLQFSWRNDFFCRQNTINAFAKCEISLFLCMKWAGIIYRSVAHTNIDRFSSQKSLYFLQYFQPVSTSE